MTDSAPVVETPTKKGGTGRRGVPRSQHEDLARLIRRIVREELAATSGRQGTVVGYDGDMVRVQVSDEQGPREVGFPVVKGQRYPEGANVLLHRTPDTADYTLGGQVGGTRGSVVANEDLMAESVDGRVIKPGQVAREHVASRAINDDKLDENAVVTGKIKDGNVTPGKLSESYSKDNHDHDADYSDKNHDHDADYSDKNHNHTEYASDNHDHDGDYATMEDVRKEIQDHVDNKHSRGG